MKRHGAVLVFKEGVTPRKAAEALEKISNVIEVPDAWSFEPTGEMLTVQGVTKERHRTVTRPGSVEDMIQEFDDDWGGPVWYIP